LNEPFERKKNAVEIPKVQIKIKATKTTEKTKKQNEIKLKGYDSSRHSTK